jgi:Flp pilus assembly pilin Flp
MYGVIGAPKSVIEDSHKRGSSSHTRRSDPDIERRSPMNEFGAGTGPESGQTMAEYAVTLGVITVALVATFGLVTAGIIGTLSNVIALI